MPLKTLLGDYPVTKALKAGQVASAKVTFEYDNIKPVQAFKRVVRNLEFDVAELALVTYLLARAHGKPLRLLPAVLTARFQHPYLVYDAERGPLRPEDLGGKRVGQRSYSVTTATWLRGILADQHGVDLSSIQWVTFEEPHVAEFRDPPNVQRAAQGKEITAMLLAGELDAAILGEIPTHARLRPVIADVEAAAADWRRRSGAALQINHMVVVKQTVGKDQEEEIYRLLVESRQAAGNPATSPFGVEPNRRNLEVAIDCVYRQRMIPRCFEVDELFS